MDKDSEQAFWLGEKIDNAAKKIYNTKSKQKRSPERWIDLYEKDARELRILSWKSAAKNRELREKYCY